MPAPRKLNKADNRLEHALNLIVRFSKGEFSAREEISGKGDELDALLVGLNTMGEELQSIGLLSEEYQKRMNELMEGALKITLGDYRHEIAVSKKGDAIDALAVALNTLSEELLSSGKTINNYHERINGILEQVLKYTLMDFAEKVPVSTRGDELDAIAVGLNTLTEELEYNMNQLRESEERFKLVVENTKDYAIYVIDPNGIIVSWNKGAERIKGYTEKEVLGKHFSIFYTPEQNPQQDLIRAKEFGSYESQAWRRKKDGSLFWADVIITPLYDENNVLKGFTKLTRDITEKRKTEEKFKGLLEAAPDALVITGKDGKIQTVNARTEKIFGYEREELIGQYVEILIPDHLKSKHPEHRTNFFENPKSRPMGAGMELFGKRKDGSEFPVEISLSPLKLGDESIAIASIRDITERKKKELEIRSTNYFLDSVLENIPNMIFVKDAKELRFVRFNAAGERLVGHSRNDLIGKNDYDFFPKEQADFFTNKDREVLSQREVIDIPEEEIDTPKGRRWLHTKKIPILNENGEPVYLLGISEDITERKSSEEQIRKKNWMLTGITEINDIIRGEKISKNLAQDIVNQVVQYLKIQIGAIYFVQDDNSLLFTAGYAFSKNIHNKSVPIQIGEGLVGQAALEKKKIVLHDVPDNYIKISSGFGEISPKEIVVVPLIHEGKVNAILELGSLKTFNEMEIEFLEFIADRLAISINASQTRERLKTLLEETQSQSEELSSQQEELRQTNEELIEQRNRLQASEEELKVKGEELEEKNKELIEKTSLLQEQNDEIKVKNSDLEAMGHALALKAEELEQTSKYKTEFLANMSHELRTPLNSILILAKLLSDNKPGNLNEKQIESAGVIYKSGNDLLSLINEILDLSKIEAGKMQMELTDVSLKDVADELRATFNEMAIQKSLDFNILIDEHLHNKIHSDKGRILQILRNLLSNAFKFTDKGGSIDLKIYPAPFDVQYKSDVLSNSAENIVFAVSDTGIGIPEDKQKLVFEAFQQVDSSTSRKFGGTGLGLTISREIAHILGGEIQLKSILGKGSTFSLYLPASTEVQQKEKSLPSPEKTEPSAPPVIKEPEIKDDKQNITEKDNVILIIEDDVRFANILQDFAHERKYKTITATQGDTGLVYAEKYMPDAIILDIQLPVIDGWEVLKKLKANEKLKNIPVHIISVVDKKDVGLQLGAIGYLKKPITKEDLEAAFDKIGQYMEKEIKTVLLIEDNAEQKDFIKAMLQESDINCITAETGKEGLEQLAKNKVDCVILDLTLPDVTGFELLEEVKKINQYINIPFIIYTSKDLTQEEENKLRKYSSAIIIKTAKSHERLLNEVKMFLHKLAEKPVQVEKPADRKLQRAEELLKAKKVLVVDDDMRNVYALINVLETQEMQTIIANDGVEALQKLEENPDTDLVLMDMMMPNMDGYEATRRIRLQEKFKTLPVIALTAKAMKGDREKCIEAGASDYISKPVDIEKLFSLMRIWLYK